MKVKVDWDLCEANALCMQAAPEVFKVDDEDMLHILMEDVPESLRAKLEKAARACPRAAISIEE
jgi:ferredoxin